MAPRKDGIDDDPVERTGRDSFPASDPPAWAPLHAGSPRREEAGRPHSRIRGEENDLETSPGSATLNVGEMNALLARNWWAAALRGVTAIVVGLLAMLWPAITLFTLILIFAGYSFVDGIFSIILALRGARRHERWLMLAVNGLVGLAAAAIAVLYPGLTIVAFVVLIAAWAILTGALSIAAAIRLKQAHGRRWMVAGGTVTILLGVVLVLAPPLGLLTVAWLIGVQALVAGFLLLLLSFRLVCVAVTPSSSGRATASLGFL